MAIDIYTVHVKPAADGAYPAARQAEAQFVREGFAWWAFLFQPLWALYHRMWFTALILVAALVLINLLKQGLGVPPGASLILDLVVALFIGAEANDWRRGALARRGLVVRGLVAGETTEDAELRYFEHAAGAL